MQLKGKFLVQVFPRNSSCRNGIKQSLRLNKKYGLLHWINVHAMVSAYNDSPPQNPALYCHVSMQLLMSENRKTIVYCYFRRAASSELEELLHDWGRKHRAKTFERRKEKSGNGLCV